MVSVRDFERRARDLQSDKNKNKSNRSTASSDSSVRDFDTSRQTLSEAVGKSTASDLRSGRVRRKSSGSDRDSSPAGGSGQSAAISRFTGIEQSTINKLSSSEQRNVSQAASDTITGTLRAARDLGVRIDPSKASNIPSLRSEVQSAAARLQSFETTDTGASGSYRESSPTDITTTQSDDGQNFTRDVLGTRADDGPGGARLRIPGSPGQGTGLAGIATTAAFAVGGYYVLTEIL